MISLVLLERQGGTERIICFNFLVPHKQFLLNPICHFDQRMYLFLYSTARDAPNLFPPDINVVLMSRVNYWTQAEAKVAERGRKTGETSCKCITFAPAKIVQLYG